MSKILPKQGGGQALCDSHRKNKVLMGYGCTANTVAEHRLPEKRDLDDWTERPLMVMKYDGHAAVCNSAMLALLSDKVKSDPGCNTETGWLYQSAFYNGVNEATAYIPTMDIIRGLSGGAEYLASVASGSCTPLRAWALQTIWI